VAKAAAEKLCLLYAQEHGLPTTTLRIWWAYGNEIGGKHIRSMIRTALDGGTLAVPAGSGGSFLQMDDCVQGMDLVLEKAPVGATYNLGTMYLTWEEIARLIVDRTNPRAEVEVVPPREWTGSGFLKDDWHFSLERVEKELGYQPRLSRDQAVDGLGQALERCAREVEARR
jgi:UDP-glucose 4-epimerase